MDKFSKILLIGGNGKLGRKNTESKLFRNIICPNKDDLDLTNIKSITSSIEKIRPEYIINCAALAREKYAKLIHQRLY